MYVAQKNVQPANEEEIYRELGNGIILQAVRDYRKALKKLTKFPEDEVSKYTKREVERFFRSSLYSAITDIPPEMLIKKLNEEVNDYE
ncbi:hypothetical protein Q5O14_08040 [Eubacteriaceae bacterium ES2]|jgi:hypothetical protein|uniref:hypothetical protein n=1 Tax=Acetobacterium sp. KB-1 TaxID=2184575 RepID=UPI000DBEBC58|nr:hypothetical protein [Acetobacterium sp. KB-1]AWW25964.1 hypothetical protein DOZ58_04465 [Acetobacterium sp. KB-1]WKY46033.1 hypothetical protein Q5O14_08040 [Eubacteriaceae bacterium ES2]